MNSDESNPTSPASLPTASLILRFAAIGLVVGGIAGLFAYAGGWLTPHTLHPSTVIDTFERLNGAQPGFRRNHAKGVCVNGYFESNGRGVALSRSSVFRPGRVPVMGRFAFAGGQPYVADTSQMVRSLALLFQHPDGGEWRTAMLNIPVFTVNTPQGFFDLLVASAPDPATGKPDPEKMKAFLAVHPETAKALPLVGQRKISSGFENSSYNGLNAFRFTNANGQVTPIRWTVEPVQPFAPPAAEAPGPENKNRLFDALIASVHRQPLQWHLILTVGQPGDSTSDATLAWPPERERIDVGTLTIDQIESEDTSPTRDINFDPLILPDGIAASDDPILSARSATYSVSFTRREGERKKPSAVSPAETQH